VTESVEVIEDVLKDILEPLLDDAMLLADPQYRSVPLAMLGLSSGGFVRLLVTIEERFQINWDLDDLEEPSSSFDALLRYVTSRVGASGDISDG
jgi:acyl carrier protein